MKQFIKSLIPPILLSASKKLINNTYGWKGDFATWQEAENDSSGYDSDTILQTVKKSLLKVKNGEAVYERDSVLFDKIQYSWPLLAGLMFCSAKNGGVLRVCDFGGSLGSTYFQNKKFLDRLNEVSWGVVEQKHFVDVGKREFEDERLKFFYDVDEYFRQESPNVLLLSSVLQYIENPYAMLEKLLKFNFDFVIIDLTSIALHHERITTQIVNPSIYKATYPCWLLNIEKINSIFIDNGYSLIEEFDALNSFEVFSEGKKVGKYIGQIRRKNDR